MTVQHPVGVRQHLAGVTRDIHEALHNDPVLSALSAPTLTPANYRAALKVFFVFYQSVERKRVALASHDDFALHDECSALSRDLGGCTPDAPDLLL